MTYIFLKSNFQSSSDLLRWLLEIRHKDLGALVTASLNVPKSFES